MGDAGASDGLTAARFLPAEPGAVGGRSGPLCGRLRARGNRGAAESWTSGRGGERFLDVTRAQGPGLGI